MACKSKGLCAGAARVWASQPARGARDEPDGADDAALRPEDMDALLSHSQPAHADDLLLATQEPEPVSAAHSPPLRAAQA